MRKLFIKISLIMFMVLGTFTFAQPMTFKNPNSPATTTKTTERKPFSATDFNKNVQKRTEKNSMERNDAINKMLAPAISKTKPKPLTLKNTPATESPLPTQPSQPTTKTQPSPIKPIEQPYAPSMQATIPSSPTATTPSSPPPVQNVQPTPQVYTGFPNQSGGTAPAQRSPSSSGGGWNIKY